MRPRLRRPRRPVWLVLGVGIPALQAFLEICFAEPWYGLFGALAAAAAPVALLAAHRAPRAVFLATLPCLYTGMDAGPLMALYPVALHSRSRWIPVLCAIIWMSVNQQAPVHYRFSHAFDNTAHFLAMTGYFMLCGAPVLLGRLHRTRAELRARVADLEAAREREDALLAGQVLATERTRLAREMHDVIAHRVGLISVQSAALEVTSTEPAVQRTARGIRELSAATLGELRQLLGVLRAPGRPDGLRAPQPSLGDLPQLVTDSGLDVDLRMEVPLVGPAAATWSGAVQHAVFRTVQEGLTNAAKHAPGAPVDVHLHATDRHLHVKVRSSRPAPGATVPDLPGSGLGITGLRERARLAGGTLEAGPTRDGGHLLHAVYPCGPATGNA
ncbi:histidine kinase [Streptomyces sp. NPDC089919]|uniref:sensor histidine kinase n=1 Tax=Streptomyces sp. NPDC089919 TaxID=3155188 RepID=UPI00343A47EF